MNERISSEKVLIFTMTFGIFVIIFRYIKLIDKVPSEFIKFNDFVIGLNILLFLISLVMYCILKRDENMND